jgi:hypothetical protein
MDKTSYRDFGRIAKSSNGNDATLKALNTPSVPGQRDRKTIAE